MVGALDDLGEPPRAPPRGPGRVRARRPSAGRRRPRRPAARAGGVDVGGHEQLDVREPLAHVVDPLEGVVGQVRQREPPRARSWALPAPRLASMPAPASLVPLPPRPTMTRSAPSRRAASSSRPTPHVLVMAGLRSSAASRCRPVAWADSTYAVRRPSLSANSSAPGTSRPSGSVVVASTVVPSGLEVARTSRKPGPPSESGMRVRRSCGDERRHPPPSPPPPGWRSGFR